MAAAAQNFRRLIHFLGELNVAPVVVNTLYIGLVAALALALGLAFGLGGRDTAARLTNQWVGQAEDTAKRLQAAAPATHRHRICKAGPAEFVGRNFNCPQNACKRSSFDKIRVASPRRAVPRVIGMCEPTCECFVHPA